MTENTTTTPQPEQAVEHPVETIEQGQAPDEPRANHEAPTSAEQPVERGNREAARYRRQLRDTEAERDQLKEHLTAARASILNNAIDNSALPGGHGLIPEAKTELALNPDDYFTDSGDLDLDKLSQTLTAELQKRPYLFDTRFKTVIPGEAEKDLAQALRGNFTQAFVPKN